MSSPPTLYHVPKTISSPIYQALLELKVVDNPVRVESLTFADLKTPEHLARNPMGTSPAFVDQELGIRIWESGAVLTYLLERYDPSYQLHPNPKDCPPAQLAKFLHLKQFIVATVYPFIASLYLYVITKPKEEQDQAYIAKGKETIRTKLAPVLMDFLGDSSFFMGGDQLTAIDLLAAKPFNNLSSHQTETTKLKPQN